jgi:tryptophan synthase alpha chain
LNRIDAIFARLRGQKRPAFMPYITAGLPDLAATAELLTALPAAGADLIELGIPFSDSVADGPTIQTSFNEVLARGITAAEIFKTVRSVRHRVAAAICAMVSITLIDRHGVDRYVGQCREAGIDGLIVPDLPPEEGEALRQTAEAAGIATIFLVAPTTSPRRLPGILAASRGFLYCIAVAGITGERSELPAHLTEYVARLRAATDKPLCVGFGISTPDQAAAVGRIADGVIVGSAVVKRLLGEGSREAKLAAALETVRELSAPLRKAGGGTPKAHT